MSQGAQEALRPWLTSAARSAIVQWREDLTSIFVNARQFFPDIVWTIEGTDETIWAHTALLYARALSEPGNNSQLLLNLSAGQVGLNQPPQFQSQSLEHIPRKVSASFSPLLQEIRQIYSAADASKDRQIDRNPEWTAENLKKDLNFMWTNRQHSDMRVVISSDDSNGNTHEAYIDEIFCHRCVLAARSPYFQEILSKNPSSNGIPTIALPFPLFTSASLHFVFGYIYTGTTKFTLKDYDLPTAFAIYRGAEYLCLPYLQELILAEIVVEKLHGLFHATLSQEDYREIVGGTWNTIVGSGCCCWRCMHLVPLTLQFALENDTKNDILERGARRALIALFGEGWCTAEFAALPTEITNSILAKSQNMIVPSNAFPLLFAAESALLKLKSSSEFWKRSIESLALSARDSIDAIISSNSQACFDSVAWENIVTEDSQDAKAHQLEWIMASIFRATTEEQAPAVYQSLVHALNKYTDQGLPELPIRKQIGHIQNQLLTRIMRNSPASSHSNVIFENATADTRNVRSRVGSPTHFAIPTLRQVFESQTTSPDLADSPQYSSASSRTKSTDYGIYYRRMAPYGRSIGHDTPGISWGSYRS